MSTREQREKWCRIAGRDEISDAAAGELTVAVLALVDEVAQLEKDRAGAEERAADATHTIFKRDNRISEMTQQAVIAAADLRTRDAEIARLNLVLTKETERATTAEGKNFMIQLRAIRAEAALGRAVAALQAIADSDPPGSDAYANWLMTTAKNGIADNANDDLRVRDEEIVRLRTSFGRAVAALQKLKDHVLLVCTSDCDGERHIELCGVAIVDAILDDTACSQAGEMWQAARALFAIVMRNDFKVPQNLRQMDIDSATKKFCEAFIVVDKGFVRGTACRNYDSLYSDDTICFVCRMPKSAHASTAHEPLCVRCGQSQRNHVDGIGAARDCSFAISTREEKP